MQTLQRGALRVDGIMTDAPSVLADAILDV
jgi:hypothetical protein